MKQRKKYVALACCLTFALCQIGCNEKQQNFTVSGFALGTIISGTLYTEGQDISQELVEMLEELEQQKLSWKLPESEIGCLNACGSGKISEDMGEYLAQVLKLCEDSDGAVDPTLGEVIELWDFDSGAAVVPQETEITDLLQYTGYENLRIEKAEAAWTVTLTEHTALNLGAVGKGIGCEELEKRLSKEEGVTGAILSLGSSSIMTFGEKPDGSRWQVAIKDPQNPEGEYLGVLKLEGTQFISTSGNYEKYFMQDGVRYHHILNPETGYPAESGVASVTVLSDDGLLSDGLSTACFVLGVEKGQELLKTYGAEGIFVDTEGNLTLTEGMKTIFEPL